MRHLILTDDASPSPATCIIADCCASILNNVGGIVGGRPRVAGDNPALLDATASRKARGFSFRSLGKISMVSFQCCAMALAPHPLFPLVASSTRFVFKEFDATLNALEYRSA